MNYRSFTLYFLFICCLLLTGCAKKVIINGIEEKEANEILVILASRDIDADKALSDNKGAGGSKEVLYNIVVTGNDSIKAMAILNKYGFPKKKSVTLLEVFNKQGLVPSEMEEKIRYRAGKEEEIASIIRKIDGVLDSNVQLSFPKENELEPEKTQNEKVTASVYVKHQGVLDDPNSHLVTKIKRLVAGSVTNLNYEDVTVIPDRARFAEIQPFQSTATGNQEKEYVKVWSIVIGKESVSAFRTVFFTFCIVVLILIIIVGWLIWKILPVLQSKEGLKEIISPSHFNILLPSQMKAAEQAKKKDDKDDDDENEDDDDDEDEDDDEEDEDEDEEE